MGESVGVNEMIERDSSLIPLSAQTEVLSFLIRDGEVLGKFNEVISEELFEHPAHRVIFTLVSSFFRQYLRVPSRDILERELGVWLTDNSGSTLVPTEMFWREVEKLYQTALVERDYMLNQIRGYLLRSQIAQLGEVSLQASRVSEVDLNSVLQEVNKLLVSLSGRIEERSEFLLADVERRVRQDPSLTKVQTGFRSLDAALGGGLGKGELGIIIAPTGYGKSFFLIALGANALRIQKKVLHITLELSKKNVIGRYESYFTKVIKKQLHMFSSRIEDRLIKMRRLLSPGDVKVVEYPSGSLSLDEFRAAITQVKVSQNFDPDVVVLDYGDLLKPKISFRGEQGWEQLATIYRDLRGIAQEFNIPLWTGSQTHQSTLGAEDISLADIAGSFAKVRIADVVVALARTKLEYQSGRGRILIDKNRENKGDITIPFKEDFDVARIWEDVSVEVGDE
jgi:replicative DNA helicase